MSDLLLIIFPIAVFAIGRCYVSGCDRIQGSIMDLEYLLGIIVAFLIMGYLFYAILYPEKF